MCTVVHTEGRHGHRAAGPASSHVHLRPGAGAGAATASARGHAQGLLESVGRGLYRRADSAPADLDLIAAATRSPAATLCLTSALAHHHLADQIPASYDIALPRGTRTPALQGPFSWHLFAADTFWLGRDLLDIDDGLSIGLSSAERSMIDAFRLRRLQGNELGNEALRRWLRRRGASPAGLLTLADAFPRTVRPLRQALDILL